MATPLDPTALGFLLAENRRVPMHVAGLHLYRRPEGAGRNYSRELFEELRAQDDVAPLFRKRVHRSIKTGGQYVWVDDDQFDIDYHVRHSALPKPGRVRDLLELVSRLHSTRMARERPLWEWHIIEGLRDGRIAMYVKLHHALVDGVAASRLTQSMLTTDPDRRDLPAPWSAHPPARTARAQDAAAHTTERVPIAALQQALSMAGEAAGLPKALLDTLNRSMRNETSALSLYAPRTILNQKITGSRRFAAQSWPIERIRSVGKATGTTINDVVLAMSSGAIRSYLLELDALPETTMISMVPVGLKAKEAGRASMEGGNAVGAVMVKLGTDQADPADRLRVVHESMRDGKQALSAMTPLQIQAMSAIGQAPAILPSLLGFPSVMRPPYNLLVSNVPGPRVPHFFNGAELLGTYPVSIPIDGMALNITCTSYSASMDFGLTGCRRTVPHLQRILTHLDDELTALESAAGVA